MQTARTARQAWDNFQLGAPSSLPTLTRDEILTSWRRSQQNGVDPEGLHLGHAEIDTASQLMAAGAPVLLGMADLLVGTHTSLAIADSAGTVIWRWESESALTRELDRIEFEPGSRVAESSAGTNAIGVATTTSQTAMVIGAEHYKLPWHAWACVASPVIHPITRRRIGSINVACRAKDANHLLLVAARSLVLGVADALRDGGSAHQRRMLEAHLHFCAVANGPVITLDRQTMIVEDDSAHLELDRRQLWSVISDAGPSCTDLALGNGLQASLYRVTPHTVDDGVVLMIRRSEGGQSRLVPRQVPPHKLGPLEQSEYDVIANMLAECNGTKSEAAARLGISRGTLYQRMRRYQLL